MTDLIYLPYNVDKIFARCAQKSISGDVLSSSVAISTLAYAESWSCFVKWIKIQLDLERTINIPNFANITSKSQGPEDKDKCIYIQILEGFLTANNLTFKCESVELKVPTVKISYPSIAKLSDLDKQLVSSAISSVLTEIQDLLISQNSLELDLGQLGKLLIKDKVIQFLPFMKSKPGGGGFSKQTVQSLLMNSARKPQTLPSLKVANEAGFFDQKKQPSQLTFLPHPLTPEKLTITPPINKGFSSLFNRSFTYNNNTKGQESPTRRYYRPEEMTLKAEMLGAGTDPLAKNQDFSLLASNAKKLISAQFTKPSYAKIRFPPILDKFSRTLAAPICSQKFNLSVSSRIGSNYTESSKRLYIDYESKCIKVVKLKESKVNFTANSDLLQKCASLEEELAVVAFGASDIELLAKLQAKKTCYKRYHSYIQEEIGIDCVAPIKPIWITDIMNLIPFDFQYLEKFFVESLIDVMVNEINKDYYDSIRKSVLDYVLKDEEEKFRLGIMETFDGVLDYGDDFYKGLEPDESWKEHVNFAREEINQNLVICNKATLKLMRLWKKYETMYFLFFPQKKDQPMTIQYYIKIQEDRINEVKTSLTTEWLKKEVTDIYHEELSQMKKNKKQAMIFFESNATMMSNQIRDLVINSLLHYRDFFRRFKKTKHLTPIDVVQMEKDPKGGIEEVFLVIKLKDEDQIISFTDSLDYIKQELLKLVKMVVETSFNIPRPENSWSRSDKNCLSKVPLDDQVVVELTVEIDEIIEGNIRNIENVVKIYNEYAFLLREMDKVHDFCSLKHERKDFQSEILKYQKLIDEVNRNVPFFVRMNMILIDGLDVKKNFLNILEEIKSKLYSAIHGLIVKKIGAVNTEITNLFDGISAKAESEKKLVELEKNAELIRLQKNREISTEFKDTVKWLLLLYDYPFHPEPEDEVKLIYTCSEQVHGLMTRVEKEEVRLRKEREELDSKLRKARDDFIQNIDILVNEIESLRTEYTEKFQSPEANKKIDILDGKLRKYLDDKLEINGKEDLLIASQTDFPKLDEAKNNLAPYQELWKLIKDWSTNEQSWERGTSIFKLNPEVIEKETKEMFKTANSLSFRLKDMANPARLCAEVLKEIKAFQVHMPLVRIFCNPGLKDRHWEEVSNVISKNSDLKGFVVRPDKEFPLKKLKDAEIYKFADKLEEISDSATKEFNIEKILNKMLEDWEPVVCELKTWKDTGTFVVSGNSVDEIQTLLDDQTVKTQTMKGSPYAKIFEARVSEWEQWLIYTWNLVEYWVKVQQVWLYLEPIFSSPDIIKHLATEAKMFKDVDNGWKSMMNKINATPKVLEFTKNKKLLDLLKECHQKLEEVQKGLNAYLEEKRNNFPRFYFLSNDELLEILSETKDPLRVQPHLKKCFEGIQKLKFDEMKKIFGMYSSEGEYVNFITCIDTSAHLGKVDEWLLITEKFMQEAVKTVISTAFVDYQTMRRDAWVTKRCGQAVLCMSMTYWTFNTEKALIEKGEAGVQEFSVKCSEMLEDIVRLVRKEIEPLDRCTIEALIVLDVHNRDVVDSLVAKHIDKITDFDWQAQLRYYWQDSNSKVRIINAELPYNYEYLGNSTRLVITPLTDRCYRTLCGALHLNYGGAPEGPAGTGKTETVKDLAKALARLCVVFNCSDGLDYKAMGKFFKGLASSGAWSCFDEFNRIDLEVLSVVAQQILTIQLARAANKEKFAFEGSEIRLVRTCNVFITMNPGYAGRSELPDNLKALFRSVAMMVPNYEMIAEISLYSYGFSNAKNLARKIVTTYKLCSEQLSSQHHYDYGMRAVKSVLTAGGNLKRKFPNEDENILMLRAINDVNLAKFLVFDLPLFEGITSDLFPSVKLPEIDYRAMEQCIDNQLIKNNLTKVDYFKKKIIQLYEMILVRHGLMVVGLSFSGKTSAIKILAAALSELKEKGLMDEKKVLITTINPKSITMKQLYGCNDDVTHEWTDGVLAVKFRVFAKNEEDERKWLIFDGPIDAVWIENMNTVLDDNKKLCLSSGEIIAMSRGMNLLFEPMDLEAASPATVSRCGMVYMEPARLGWGVLFQSWKLSLPKHFKEEDINEIDLLFDWSVNPILEELRKRSQEISPTQDQNLVMSLLRIYRCMLQIFDDEAYYAKSDLKSKLNLFDQFFVFSAVWSLGGSVTTDYRKPMNLFMKRLFGGDMNPPADGKKKKISLPDSGLLYDYKYDLKSQGSLDGEWIPWVNFIDQGEVFPKNIQVNEILVKTSDTIRYSFLLKTNILNEIPSLFCGPTGTGKSMYIKNLLLNGLDKEKYKTTEVGFSAQTTSTQTQDIIDTNLDRRKRGISGPIYGPKVGKAIIFVDDLNMPAKEKWGAQPPIEILRQMMDQGGWYDHKDKERPFKTLVDLIFVAAMGPPGGGRTFITPRLLRHLNLISLAQFDDDTLNRIFNTILHWFFTSNNFNGEIIKMENKIVISTLDLYKYVIEKLLPTPMKSHYLFNLRDFAKVVSGICMSDKDKLQSQEQVVRLWTHEILRVFSDRLINEEDRLTILQYLRENVIRSRFGLNFDTIFAFLDKPHGSIDKDGKVDSLDEIRGLMFTDIMSPAGIPKRYYEEILDYSKLQQSVEQSLENYNIISDKPMDLVLFNFAVEHLLIIARILKQPQGNALLVGVGGSGRQSLTKLAARISDYEVFQIEITRTYGKNEWKEDLKKILKQAGAKFVPTVFLFTDSQIKDESFIEDINNLLNTGEVPNIYTLEEKSEIMELVRNQARVEGKAPDGTPAQLSSYFVNQCKKQLHIVLCFSPIGDALRNRVRMFPSLVNCCTIDWFNEWPNDALVSVARKFLLPIEMNEQVREGCVEMVQYFHESTSFHAKRFYLRLQRKYYVTPTSYIEMITTFRNLLSEKRKEVLFQKYKYENGYEKIITTEKKVEEMQVNLIELQPKLKLAAEETEKKMKEVAEQKGQADILKEATSKEESIVQTFVNEAQIIKDDCQKDLDEAMPLLLASEEALKVLEDNKKDLDTVKKLGSPPNPIKYTMQALCYLLYPNPAEKKKNPETLKIEVDWWAASQKLMSDIYFIKKLIDFNSEEIEEKNILALGKFLKDPQFSETLKPESVEKASQSCKCLIQWINGVYSYYFVNKKVKPKKQKLKESEDKVNELQSRLADKQKELKNANDKVERLNSDLMITKRNKDKLEKEYDECSKQLLRAKKLIENLGGEKGRWAELALILKEFYNNLTGDILISSGMIAYLGAFTSVFRNEICSDWVAKTLEKQIPGSSSFSLEKVLGDPVKIREWNINGLPSDTFSIENGIIVSKARRWPLCIDPQNQANKWIKKMGISKKINIIKLTDTNFIRTLENSIQFGQPVLLENVGEELDPVIQPILLKQTFQKGSTTYIKLGPEPIEYNSSFFFYITTKLRNPHYLPEISTKVTLLNFMITYEGLNDQLLGILVKKERPDLEQEKERIIVEGADNKKQLQDIEDKILAVLSSDKNILLDEEAINILTASKVKSNEIKEKQAIAEQTEKSIDEARQQYQSVSQEASCLFFAITDLNNLDPMYQYSLVYYIDLFTQAILKSKKSENLEERLQFLKEFFLYSLYCNICRSLFEKDKLTFSFLLSTRILEFHKQLSGDELRFLLTGGLALDEKMPIKPISDWLSSKAWGEIFRLSKLTDFKDFYKDFEENLIDWKKIYDHNEPHSQEFPGKFAIGLTSFQKLMIVRSIRPDRVVPAIQDFVKEKLGAEFIDPPPFNLSEIFRDSTVYSPLIFVLSPGSDPFASLNSFGGQMKKDISSISLGQGQGPLAQKMIDEAIVRGNWVVLQNCHLAVSWMPTLEKICDEIDPIKTHQDFRLWLTSYPSVSFPTSILQNGVKMTNEPPKGLKANLKGSFLIDPINNMEFFNGCKLNEEFKRLLYGLCFFHAVIQERRKYGPLGWNIPYEFNESDLRICVRQLKMFLDETENSVIPFEALKYLTAECNYGGRVTEEKDRRLINTLLEDFYCHAQASDLDYQFASNPVYKLPKIVEYDHLIEFIQTLPLNTQPEVFGFHANADITKDINETLLLFSSVLACSSEGKGGETTSMESLLEEICRKILDDFPNLFNLEEASQKYPVDYKESMNTVLTQELTRFNKLIKVIRVSLADIRKALKGEVLMSPALEKASRSLYDGKIPDLWMDASYPSLKPLGSYIVDLKLRIAGFRKWLDETAPTVFWISGFYFTQSFLTGVLQNFARKYTIPIDEIEFDFEFIKEEIKEKPKDGAYVQGLYIEGAKWDYEDMCLTESDPKTLFVKCPVILMRPVHFKNVSDYENYECPVYKTSLRRGVLSTTGHSTNYVMQIRVPCKKDMSRHWIKRGVALLTQLDD